jgi:hypothetical protein
MVAHNDLDMMFEFTVRTIEGRRDVLGFNLFGSRGQDPDLVIGLGRQFWKAADLNQVVGQVRLLGWQAVIDVDVGGVRPVRLLLLAEQFCIFAILHFGDLHLPLGFYYHLGGRGTNRSGSQVGVVNHGSNVAMIFCYVSLQIYFKKG